MTSYQQEITVVYLISESLYTVLHLASHHKIIQLPETNSSKPFNNMKEMFQPTKSQSKKLLVQTIYLLTSSNSH